MFMDSGDLINVFILKKRDKCRLHSCKIIIVTKLTYVTYIIKDLSTFKIKYPSSFLPHEYIFPSTVNKAEKSNPVDFNISLMR